MPPKRRLPTGTVGLLGQDTARFHEFTLALKRLELPAGWETMGALNYDAAHGSNFLARNFEGDRLFLLGDDHTFDPDILVRLLEHDLPVVGALCAGRRSPFPFGPRMNDAPLKLGPPGLVEVSETGSAGLLIKREVFDELPNPCFWHGTQPDGSYLAEDWFFCRLLREHGIPIYVDTSVVLGHIATTHITPHWDEKQRRWVTRFWTGGWTYDTWED